MLAFLTRVERLLGSAKFAVIIILIFAIALTYGTFMESYHGTEYANRLIYKSSPFFALQFLMFLSIFIATLMRLPFKKHLAGFYVLHLGLLILFVGSFITFTSGLDGSMPLEPNLPQRTITLNEDEFEIRLLDKGIKLVSELPFHAGEVVMNHKLKTEHKDIPEIEIIKFLPFANNVIQWQESTAEFLGRSSAQYQLFNDRFGETLTLSTHPFSDFPATTSLGLLNVHYMPKGLAPCFKQNPKSALIIWNVFEEKCFTPEEKKIKISKTKKGQRHLQVGYQKIQYNFFPELAPMPVDEKLQVLESSPLRIFSLKIFETKPHLFTFGRSIAYYDKNQEEWISASFDDESILELPWMGFQLRLMNFHEERYPVQIPQYVVPIQDNGKIVLGSDKAVLFKVAGKEHWIKQSDGPMQFMYEGKKIGFELKKKQMHLPYEINLDRFKMDTDPGTNNPASYESFLTLFNGKDSQKHHVYMNNPLKHQSFTFYQASYFEVQGGGYGSVLSVNFDPGRPWKYLGALLLVFGSAWHFSVRHKRMKQEKRQTHVQDTLVTSRT